MKKLILIAALATPFSAMAEFDEPFNEELLRANKLRAQVEIVNAKRNAEVAIREANQMVKFATREKELMQELMYTKGKLDQAEKFNKTLLEKLSCEAK